jgi:hypothetical protein
LSRLSGVVASELSATMSLDAFCFARVFDASKLPLRSKMRFIGTSRCRLDRSQLSSKNGSFRATFLPAGASRCAAFAGGGGGDVALGFSNTESGIGAGESVGVADACGSIIGGCAAVIVGAGGAKPPPSEPPS